MTINISSFAKNMPAKDAQKEITRHFFWHFMWLCKFRDWGVFYGMFAV